MAPCSIQGCHTKPEPLQSPSGPLMSSRVRWGTENGDKSYCYSRHAVTSRRTHIHIPPQYIQVPQRRLAWVQTAEIITQVDLQHLERPRRIRVRQRQDRPLRVEARVMHHRSNQDLPRLGRGIRLLLGPKLRRGMRLSRPPRGMPQPRLDLVASSSKPRWHSRE